MAAVLYFASGLHVHASPIDIMKLDSLERRAETADSTEKLILYQTLFEQSKATRPLLAMHYLKQQMAVADAMNHTSVQVDARLQIADLLYASGKNDSALYYLEEAVRLRRSELQPMQETRTGDDVAALLINPSGFSWKSAFLWKTLLIMSFLLLPLSVVLMLLFSHRIKEKYLKVQEDYGLFQQTVMKERQQLEGMIQERTNALEEQLRETRAKELELKKTLKRLTDASYLKNAFLANMSHEIRTPLNGIIGFASLLETELAMMEDKELYNYASGIQQSGDRLLNLINNIIEISRIQANEIDVELHPCQPSTIINNACEPLIFSANEKGLKFKTKLLETPQVIADESKLMRVLHIIIENAIKYTESGFVTVSTAIDPTGRDLIIRVKDTGIGMERSYMNYLFDAFRQENAGYSRPYQGAGLGLPLAKKLLDLMHGQITVQSEKGIGTTVEISLPLLVPAQPGTQVVEAEPKPLANAPEIGKLDIFVVEDDRMNRMVLQKLLARTGVITMAVDGAETMKIVSERHKKGHIFQVMLFDINLPAPWDGVKLLQQIRTDFPAYKQVPFIAQTAYAMAGDKERFLDAGFDDYIAKPVNKNELLTKIEQQLKLRSTSIPTES